MFKKRLFFLLLFYILSNNLFAQDTLSYPESWGGLSGESLNGSQCPNIQGEYQNDGEPFEYVDGKENGVVSNGYHRESADVFFYFNKKPSNSIKEIDSSDKKFSINYHDVDKLEITKYSALTKTTDNFIFSLVDKEFSCSNGWIILSTNKSGGYGESGKSEVINDVSLSRLKDGSLVAYSKQVSKSYFSLFILYDKREIDDFVKFKPLEREKN